MEKRQDDAPAEKSTSSHGIPDPVDGLLHSPGLLQAVLDNSLVGIVLADTTGRIILANPAAREIMGGHIARTTYGLEGECRFFHPDGSPIPSEDLPLARALQRGETIGSMKILVRKNAGSETLLRAYAAPIRDAAGTITGALAIFVDHTELKPAEPVLHESREELLQAIIDSIPVVVTVWRPHRKLIMANKEFERVSGWSVEEAKHMDIVAAAFPNPAYRREIIRQVTKAGPGWGEFVMNTRSGRKSDILWSAIDLSDGSRMGIGIDITGLKKLESDMLRLATAVGQVGEGIALFDSEWTIEYVNPAFETLSGYTRKDLVGKKLNFLLDRTVGDFDPRKPIETASGGNTWSGNIKVSRESGETLYLSLTVSPVKDKTGRIINYISMNQDITHEVKLQQMMMQSQKMESIGTLAGGIAHDLKNIFTPILINSEMAVEDVGRDSPIYPLLEEILNAARMGTDLVKQIMTFTRQTAENKVEVDVSSVVRETLSLLRSAIPKTIEIKTGIYDDNAVVRANPTQIKQVLMNLGSNAAYAMRGQHGILEVDVSCIDLDKESASKISPEMPSGPYVELDVKDTGVGMDEKTLQRIFEPFFTTKLYGEGTGMGLSVVQGIVKEQGGAVSVWSRPGEGSIFRILLPRLSKTSTGGTETY